MLIEIIVILLSYFSGRLISSRTEGEIKKWGKTINLLPLVFALANSVVLTTEANLISLLLLGALVSFAFRKKKNEESQAFFATITTNNATIPFSALYFMTKGSLSNKKPARIIVSVLLAGITSSVLNVHPLPVLFAGALLGGELAVVTKNKS